MHLKVSFWAITAYKVLNFIKLLASKSNVKFLYPKNNKFFILLQYNFLDWYFYVKIYYKIATRSFSKISVNYIVTNFLNLILIKFIYNYK